MRSAKARHRVRSKPGEPVLGVQDRLHKGGPVRWGRGGGGGSKVGKGGVGGGGGGGGGRGHNENTW